MTDAIVASRLTRLAAIDIGTNSIRCVVAEVEPTGSYRVLDEEREMTRLGHDLFKRGRLAVEPMERSYAALTKMKAIADGFQVDELRAVATSAVREASNGRAFCREVRRRCGLAIEVISPDEEAQLALLSALRAFDLVGRSVGIVDIGGGSVEVVLAAGAVVDQVYTLPLGAVRLTEAYGGAEPLRRRRWKRLRRAIDRVLDERIGEPPFNPEVIIGSGGTFTNLAGLIKTEREGSEKKTEKNLQGYTMRRAEVVHLLHRLRVTPLELRRAMPGLNPLRADIIVAGAAVVARVARRLGAQQIVVNPGGLRSGLLLSMIAERQAASGDERVRSTDRLESVRAFARKCHSGERHCEHVALLAGQLFDGLRGPHSLPVEGRDILVAAALLHDVGYLINHAKHHKHAYHLIQNAELQGWTAREVELIANVARYHRKAAPKQRHGNFRRLERADRRQVRRLAAILRVADGLDRTHTQRITAVGVEPGRGAVRLILAAETDPQVERWDADRKAGLFAKVFDGVPAFVWARGGVVQRRRAKAARAHRSPRLRIAAG
ncbi:MAG TPA: Ppx/GppA phosphatase family protein [Gemmatimonadales bacterium]|jgi:exopolyphosphatase/guanosine-5'-triphosphate,3'-diphosphate pyrophosphatase|nr:Ppx/GppA phosphatase family protein [Gemmatimonadales bacterium]